MAVIPYVNRVRCAACTKLTKRYLPRLQVSSFCENSTLPRFQLQNLFRQINRSIKLRTLTAENQYERLSECVTPLYKIPYNDQLQMKENHMRNRLVNMVTIAVNSWPKRVCGRIVEQAKKFDGQCCPLEEIKPSPVIYGYRNKNEMSVGTNFWGNHRTVGLFVGKRKNKGKIVCVEPTELNNMSEDHKALVKFYQGFIRQASLPPWRPHERGGYWRDIVVRSNNEGHLMFLVRFHPQNLTQSEIEKAKTDLAHFFKNGPGKSLDLYSLYFQSSPQSYACANRFPLELLYGQPYLEMSLSDMKFRVSPSSFFQTNTTAAEVLYSTVADVCELTPNSTVLDVFCGTGTIGTILSKTANRVIGIDIIESAVRDATCNAQLNGCQNTEFLTGNADKIMNKLFRSDDFHEDDVIAVVNPGRNGMNKKGVRAIRRCSAIRRLVYVTCKPHGNVLANFAHLCVDEMDDVPGEPFLPVKAVPVDMFPHTVHTELIVVFQR